MGDPKGPGFGFPEGSLKIINEGNFPGPMIEGKRVYDRDPSGKSLKEPGTKGDLGKIPVTRGCLHYFPRALLEVARLSYIGATKYSWKGWEHVPDGINRYSDALGRHELSIQGDFDRTDRDTGVLEAAAVAWNALARLELILREREQRNTTRNNNPL